MKFMELFIKPIVFDFYRCQNQQYVFYISQEWGEMVFIKKAAVILMDSQLRLDHRFLKAVTRLPSGNSSTTALSQKLFSITDLRRKFRSYMLRASGVRKYDLCDFSATKECQLRSHNMIHTEKKLYQCGSCDYSCSRADKLKIHSYTHTGKALPMWQL